MLRISRPSNCSLLWVCFRFRKEVELRFGSNPFSGPFSLFFGPRCLFPGPERVCFRGWYIYSEPITACFQDYMNLFWSMEGACGETKAELKS
jgi:hypothetical protein